MKGTLRNRSKSNNLRTEEVVGWAKGPPIKGEPFEFSAKPLDPDFAVRAIWTSPVVESFRKGDAFYFETESGSHYCLEVDTSDD